MQKVVTAAQMRAAEELTVAAGISTAQLMERAGNAAATVIAEEVIRSDRSANVLVLCGPGNNGGDGLVVARRLSEAGYTVSAYTFGRQQPPPALRTLVRHENDQLLTTLRAMLGNATIIVDALLGTGRSRPIEGPLSRIMGLVRQARQGRTVVALDLPSGLDADSGGADPYAVAADLTITFGYAKRGLLIGRGQELAGRLVVVDIGLLPDAAADVMLWLVDEAAVRARIPPRARSAHKYSAGAVLIVAGSHRFTGAPRLAALGAERAGAGLVTLATGASTHPVLAVTLLEPTFLPLPDQADGVPEPEKAAELIRNAAGRYRAALIGPGLAQSPQTVELVEMLVCGDVLPDALPLVVDAEGLNALAQIERWHERTRHPIVLTPHVAEMARLSGDEAKEIDANRFEIAPARAREWSAVVVLKGSPTVTAASNGSAIVNASGGPNLATGGTGDVLGGIIASLIAQGSSPFDAAIAGVYIHGCAGDLLARSHGDRGTLAGDLPDQLPGIIKAIRERQ
jgi:NAD(P)H-hydrate epimerase